MNKTNTTVRDSGAQDWTGIDLPDAWPDQLNFASPLTWLRLLRRSRQRKNHRVELPHALVGSEKIPAYALLEFHGLPNGNYSNSIARGYARSFDHVMLGTLLQARREVAQSIGMVNDALDVGCGAGAMIRALQAAGAKRVAGVDPSPYLLQFAAETTEGVQLYQGVAESLEFPDASQDAVTACFVFHELPPARTREAFAEIYRVLRPGGRLAFIEPSRHQWDWSWSRLFARYGWKGLYFRFLARLVQEPFVQAWHAINVAGELHAAGFRLESETESCPLRVVFAKKPL